METGKGDIPKKIPERELTQDTVVRAIDALRGLREKAKRMGEERKVFGFGSNSLKYAKEVATHPGVSNFLDRSGLEINIVEGIRVRRVYRPYSGVYTVVFFDTI